MADIRLLNATANALLGLLALALLGSAVWWLVHRPLFTLREVKLEGPDHGALQHVSPSTVRGTALPRIKGNFFTANLEEVERRSNRCPGCGARRCGANGPTSWWW